MYNYFSSQNSNIILLVGVEKEFKNFEEAVIKQSQLLSRQIISYDISDGAAIQNSIKSMKSRCEDKCIILSLCNNDLYKEIIYRIYKEYIAQYVTMNELTNHIIVVGLIGSDLGAIDKHYSEGHMAIVGFAKDVGNIESRELEEQLKILLGDHFNASLFNDHVTDYMSISEHVIECTHNEKGVKAMLSKMYNVQFMMSSHTQSLKGSNTFTRGLKIGRIDEKGDLMLHEDLSNFLESNSEFIGFNEDKSLICSIINTERPGIEIKEVVYGIIVFPTFTNFGEKISILYSLLYLRSERKNQVSENRILEPYIIDAKNEDDVDKIIQKLKSENKRILFLIGGWR